MTCLCSLSRVCCPDGLKVFPAMGAAMIHSRQAGAHTIRQSCPVTDFSDAYCPGG